MAKFTAMVESIKKRRERNQKLAMVWVGLVVVSAIVTLTVASSYGFPALLMFVFLSLILVSIKTKRVTPEEHALLHIADAKIELEAYNVDSKSRHLEAAADEIRKVRSFLSYSSNAFHLEFDASLKAFRKCLNLKIPNLIITDSIKGQDIIVEIESLLMKPTIGGMNAFLENTKNLKEPPAGQLWLRSVFESKLGRAILLTIFVFVAPVILASGYAKALAVEPVLLLRQNIVPLALASFTAELGVIIYSIRNSSNQ